MDSMQGEASGSIGPSLKVLSLKAPQLDFCDSCLFVRLSASGYSYHSLTCNQLEESAKLGECRTCVGLFKFIKSQQPKPSKLKFYRYHDSLELRFLDVEDDTISQYEMFFSKDELDDGENTVYNNPDLPPDRAESLRYIPTRHMPSGDTSSTAAFDTLRQWIFQCQAEHTLCKPAADSTLPHRVLKIKSIQPLRVQVVEDCTDRRSYVCLSHRWSPQTELKSLKKENLHLYKGGIPEDNINLLMRDAIRATFRLGLRFIWIDCYCIIQDDKKDWEEQAANMGFIYEKAICTISATSSTDGQRMFSTMAPKFKPFQITKVSGHSVYIRSQIPHPSKLRGFLQTQERLHDGLLQRAWVFQERMLSKRFIHFTSEEIFWECCEATWCECNFRCGGWDLKRSCVKRTIGHLYWEDIANQYNETQLTKEKDRLPALAGLAQRYAEQEGWTYLAGLWKEQLPYDLAWSKTAWHEARRLDHLQVAPTWSWASLPRGKNLKSMSSRTTGRRKGVHVARLVGYNINPSGADFYTGGKSIEITVQGLTLGLKVYQHSCGFLAGIVEDVSFPIRPDFRLDLGQADPTKYRTVPDGTRCLLLVLSMDGNNDACGIVLLQQNRGAKGKAARYERIGILTTDDKWYFDRSGRD